LRAGHGSQLRCLRCCRSPFCSVEESCCCSTESPVRASSFLADSTLAACFPAVLQTSHLIRAVHRFFGSTCFGSSVIRKFTSRFFQAWAQRRTFSPRSHASLSLVIAQWCLRYSQSAYSDSLSGATTCLSAA